MPNSTYIMACDERGTTRWPSSSKTWAIGGFIVGKSNKESAIVAWDKVKRQLCGQADVELKWSHFFSGYHQKSGNPLISTDPDEWRQQAKWALSTLFSSSQMLPIATVVRKDRGSNDMFMEIREDGVKILEREVLWVGIVGQFATYLEHFKTSGEIWFDQLGSRSEEDRWQATWKRLRNKEWPNKSPYQKRLKRIAQDLRFF